MTMAADKFVKQSDGPNPNYTYDPNFTPNTYHGGDLVRNWNGTVANKPTWGQFGKELGKSLFSMAGATGAESDRPAGATYWAARRRMPDHRLALEVLDQLDAAGENPNVTIDQVRARNAAERGMKPAAPVAPAATSAAGGLTPDYSGMAYYGLGGAGAGALLGAALGRKGKRGQGALLGAGLGGGAGMLAHYLANNKTAAEKQAIIGTALGLVGHTAYKGLVGDFNKNKKTDEEEEKVALEIPTALRSAGGAIAGGLGGAAGYLKNNYDKLPQAVRSGIGMGGIGGAALGGLAGLVAPGENVEYDEMGREVKRNPRNRFGAMMRGALGGGLAGAGAGAAAGHFAPQQTQQTADYFRQQGHNLHQKYLMHQLQRQKVAPEGMQA